MSALDILRAFSETSMRDEVPIADGITYGNAREALGELQLLTKLITTYRGMTRDMHNGPEDCSNYYDGCHCLAIRAAGAEEALALWFKYNAEADVASPDDWDDLIERTIAIIGEQE
jgi:hypothetical protein